MAKTTSRRAFLKASSLAAAAAALRGSSSLAQSAQADAHIEVLPSERIGIIAPELYSHFIEHLGGVIYDGVWVGEGSRIPNINGIRKDFIDTMKAVQAPVLRWPGGCFADSYDWRDGIGPRTKRPARTAFWSQQDTNGYGLHEFMHTCQAIGCEPYLAANIRSLPARDFYQFMEYCNAPAGNVPSNSAAPAVPNSLAAERTANGDPAPFNVDYWGVGNETWGCGGNQTPEEYASQFRRFTAWTPTYNNRHPRFVAVGPNGDDADWTRRLFASLHSNPEHPRLWGLSVHYYTSGRADKFAEGDALRFSDAEYYDMLARAGFMERIITDHWAAMGDNNRGVKLVVDEWGAWYGKGTELGLGYNLSQQSTMRDALLSAITLDTFHRHADKVAMANVAQSINCLHSLMLAQEDRFIVTPTYHIFRMYLPHRTAQAVRAEFSAGTIDNPLAVAETPVGGASAVGSIRQKTTLAALSGSASIKGKTLTLTVVNPHLTQSRTTEIAVREAAIVSARGTVLFESDVHAHNDFTHPNTVQPHAAATTQPTGGRLTHTFPPASITALEITLT